MRTPSKPQQRPELPIPQPSTKQAFDWGAINCRLLWYYSGAPNTTSGTFETVNFIIWRMVRGSVEIKTPSCLIRAKAGEWVIMAHNLGRRHQSFSSDALIESLHLGIDTQPAEWTGPSVVVLPNHPALSRAAAEVGKYLLARFPSGLTPGGNVYMSRDFLEQTLVKKQAWSFMAELAPLLAEKGMYIREPDFSDPRIVSSMALIESWPVNLPWDRKQISRAASVSPSQLDRIWRETRGETPFQYWNSRRVRFACDRLENSSATIKEIAFDLGFSHLAQFSTWFHGRMNTSPREYRRAFIG